MCDNKITVYISKLVTLILYTLFCEPDSTTNAGDPPVCL